MTPTAQPAGSRFQVGATLASLIPMVAGCLVLAGWVLGIMTLKSVVPGLTEMNPLTAWCFILGGGSVWLQRKPNSRRLFRWLARVCGALVALAGLLILCRYLFHWPITLDQMLFPATLGKNRMAPNTALNFLLLGTALLLLDAEFGRGRFPAPWLALAPGLIAMLALIGYAYGVRPLYNVPSYIAMALNTAVAFLTLALAILLARPERGFMATITSDTAGGIMARRLLPAAIILPLLLGWLRLIAQQAGLLSLELGVTLFALACVVIIALLIWWNARLLYATDIRRQHVEEALRRSEEGFRQLAESLPQLVWTCRADGPCDFLSRQWIEYTGISAAEQLGFGWLQQLHPEDRERTVAAWNAAVQSGGSFDVEFRIRRRDGMYRWFKTRAVPMRDAEGQIVKWFGSNTDIDDLQRMEQDLAHYVEELRRSNQDLEQFAYAASHDLQEPLRKIRSFGDLLQEDFGPTLPDEGRRHIATMQDAAKRMQRLIEDLLNYARLTTQGMAFVAVNLQETVKAVLSDLEARVTATGARVEVNRLPVIEADATQMHQLFLNLLGNALKFHKDSEIPVVKVYALAAEPEEGECRVVVEDNGIGFDPKYADRIFGVFQRLHNRSTYEGSGIGLALCRRIVQRHGGHIAVRSQPGQGTAFTVSLPVRQAGTHRTGGADEPARETHSVADG